MVPATSTRNIVRAELPGAQALGSRHELLLDWNAEKLSLRVTGLCQPPSSGEDRPPDDDQFVLVGLFDSYRALPPIWDFEDPDTGELGTLAAFPQPDGPTVSSIFITSDGAPIVCAPFSRRAYGENGGPHKEWGTAAGWLDVGGGVVRATSIGEMLNAFLLHLRWTRGRMAPRAAS